MLVKKCRKPGNLRYKLHPGNRRVEVAVSIYEDPPSPSFIVYDGQGRRRKSQKKKALPCTRNQHVSPFDERGSKNNFERMIVGRC